MKRSAENGRGRMGVSISGERPVARDTRNKSTAPGCISYVTTASHTDGLLLKRFLSKGKKKIRRLLVNQKFILFVSSQRSKAIPKDG